ncbi:MAG TPA: hypothetical protein VET65_12590 [Candidatus Limnocylindrales bacterium]|nr:hypothetical protein [Candidatus Limnocylindrales bacterium]
MTAMVRHLTAFGGRIAVLLLLFAMLAPPFGVRAILEAHAIDQARAASRLLVFQRPAAALKVPVFRTRNFALPLAQPALAGVDGKGGWFMIFDGDWADPDADRAAALVDSAVRADLSHVYIRVADSTRHFYASNALQDLLPLAHAKGLKVIGWIEPALGDPAGDAADAVAAARFQEEGQRLDGLALTMEQITQDPNVSEYLSAIRSGLPGLPGLGKAYLLIASTFPTPYDHPSSAYASMSRYCQVFAPMTYWRATGLPQYASADGVRAYIDQVFAQFHDPSVNPLQRPLSITAQAYDAVLENGTPGAPPVDEIVASMDETRAQGGVSWSFYRLADANNGVTGDESAAITAYPFWQRPALVPARSLIASSDQPVAY